MGETSVNPAEITDRLAELEPDDLALLRAVGKNMAACGEKIWLVGGAVRDMALGGTPKDFDFVTTATPAGIRKALAPLSRHIYDKSPAKGFATHGIVLRDNREIEVTPLRTPPDGISASTPLAADLMQRDFTINAIAASLAPDTFGHIDDPLGGMADLRAGILRTPLAPETTIKDDPLRVVRAVRFAAAFHLALGENLTSAIKITATHGRLSDTVSTERVHDELVKMLLLPRPSSAFCMMYALTLMDVWLPEVAALARLIPEDGAHHKDIFEHTMTALDKAALMGPVSAPFMFAVLLHDIGKQTTRQLSGDGRYTFHDHDRTGAVMARSICERLRWSNDDTAHVVDIVAKHHRIHHYTSEYSDAALRRALHDIGHRYDEILTMARADITSSMPEKVAERLAAVDEFARRIEGFDRKAILDPRPPLDGNEVMRLLGDRPGPRVGRVMNFLKDLVIAGELSPADRERAAEIVLSRVWDTK